MPSYVQFGSVAASTHLILLLSGYVFVSLASFVITLACLGSEAHLHQHPWTTRSFPAFLSKACAVCYSNSHQVVTQTWATCPEFRCSNNTGRKLPSWRFAIYEQLNIATEQLSGFPRETNNNNNKLTCSTRVHCVVYK